MTDHLFVRICLWLTPVFWLASVSALGYASYLSVVTILPTAIVVGVLWKRRGGPIAAALAVYVSLWWLFWPAAASAALVAIAVLLPRRFWLVGGAAVGMMVIFSILNPPIGPEHMASPSGIALVVHTLLLGAVALPELRRPS